MLIRRARMIFLQSRLCFVENAARYMNLRPGAYGLTLEFVPLGAFFLKLMTETL